MKTPPHLNRFVVETVRFLCFAAVALSAFSSAVVATEDEWLGLTAEIVDITTRAALPETPLPEADWTVLFYSASDFSGFNATEHFALEMQSTANVHVLILDDPQRGSSRIYHVTRTSETEAALATVRFLGEPDMTDPSTLIDFLKLAQELYPSKRTLLAVYSHGSAWMGGAVDDTNAPPTRGDNYELPLDPSSLLTPVEFRTALDATSAIDALVFTGTCLMGALETAYEVRNRCDLYVGSEDVSGYLFWFHVLTDLREVLASRPNLSLSELGKHLVQSVSDMSFVPGPRGAPRNLDTLTMSGSSLSAMGDVASAIDKFARALLDYLPEGRATIGELRAKAQDFYYSSFVDIQHFAELCGSDPVLEESARSVQEALSRAILLSISNERAPDARGFTLYFPWQADPRTFPYGTYASLYQESGLAFLEDTAWDEFLEAFLSDSSSTSAP